VWEPLHCSMASTATTAPSRRYGRSGTTS
jgi:hypothetical protein